MAQVISWRILIYEEFNVLDLQSRIDRLTEEQQMIRDSAASFFSDDGDLKGIRAQRGQQPGYRDERWQSMAALGWLGLM
ncbi:MAG TPA: hypothetical protein DCZ12_09145, partial [Gammaproteobacteria bacterium]|nr:hypothetical protein [Gammaproteobacteria bacterium]